MFYLHTGLIQQGLTSVVYCPIGSELAKKLPASQQLNYKKRSGFDLAAAFRLTQQCKKGHFQLVHAHDAHSHTTAVLAATLFRNTPPIVLSRRVDFPIGGSAFSSFKYNHSRIQTIVCVSKAIENIVRPNISNSNIHLQTIHSSVDLNRYKNVEPLDLRAELGLKSDTKIVANVAALADHKDYFTFLDTVKRISETTSQPISFLAIGSGSMETEIKAYCKKLRLENKVIFLGFRKDLPEIYPNIDILLFTSKTEGLGTSILDAFANSVPVVATNAGGIPEMIEHEATGLLANVGDSAQLTNEVLRLLNDETLQKKLSQNGLQKLNAFSVGTMVSKFVSLYQNITNK